MRSAVTGLLSAFVFVSSAVQAPIVLGTDAITRSNACGTVSSFVASYDLAKTNFPKSPGPQATLEDLQAYLHAWEIYRLTDIEPYNAQLHEEFTPRLGLLSDLGLAAMRNARCTPAQFEELRRWINEEFFKSGTSYLQPYKIAVAVLMAESKDAQERATGCKRRKTFGRSCGN